MSKALYGTAVVSGDRLAFRDSAGKVSYIAKQDMNSDIEVIYSDPEALRVFNESLEDYADGRFVDFEF
ncbi:hypothetical protein CPHO_01940 [Corynebacterium phocae]|uniref:Uncharacterized protein n=1 Tax=Corynebacterium phocae TaxID=161895 RepID=A0A1L7D1A0_9CORY|nr:hypothetical protein [Corynebacterium phocae]APT91870.1 hypothetical protein CPHO_01940 [Corynebacterium phocae]KAA8727416.1 hypothetical protein F4V58_01470 [Corynebacterium phocae]